MELAEAGQTVKSLENCPILQPGLDVYLDAYKELSYDRPVGGMSPGFIPWSSIIKWCHLNGIYDIDEIATCTRYIRKLEQTDNELSDKRSKR